MVEKAKKCLDFGATLFIFHLLACWTYEVRDPELTLVVARWIDVGPTLIYTNKPTNKRKQAFPSTGLWWVIHIAGVVVMILLGTYVYGGALHGSNEWNGGRSVLRGGGG